MHHQNITLLKQRAKFITIYDTTNANTFLILKDRTPKDLQSSVVARSSIMQENEPKVTVDKFIE
jgi:hypothetical protein